LKKVKLRERLSKGQIALGTAVYSFSPTLVEIAGYCGLDFVRIDTEHAWRKDSTIEYMIMAAELGDITPVVRVDKDDPYIIRKVLEIGAQGIVVSHIDSKEEAEKVVEAAKFPPRGIRGFGMCHSAKWAPDKDWMNWSNEEPMIGIMVESTEAVNCIEEIMAVEGLDFALFGPADYSISAGVPTETSHPKVLDAIEKTIKAAEEKGKAVALSAAYPWAEDVERLVKMGARMITIGQDASILRTIWKMTVEDARKRLKTL
jgi:2-keto-3-deoxy-L-rhamnonate aldolase RhmA